MKATTLTQRISKTNNANRSTPKNSDYEMAIYILQAGKAYVSYGGSKYGAAKSRTPERYLIAWGIDFKSGNDAPRGGKAGDFIELTKKGNTQVKDYRLMLMNQKIEAEKQEAIRVENERIISELHEKRKLESLPYLSFWSDFEKDLNFGKQSESDFNSFLERIKKAKNDFDAEQEKIRVENARLQKEAVEKERQRQSEIKAEQEKQAKLKANADKLQAELQAKKDAETKAENERLAKIEADKKANDALLKAGQKKQIESWIETFQIEIPEHLKQDEIANDILSKFWSFKSWAKKQI